MELFVCRNVGSIAGGGWYFVSSIGIVSGILMSEGLFLGSDLGPFIHLYVHSVMVSAYVIIPSVFHSIQGKELWSITLKVLWLGNVGGPCRQSWWQLIVPVDVV